MAVTDEDLQDFNRYASKRVNNGGVDSMATLFRDWLDQCEAIELADDVRQAQVDIAAGLGKPAAEVFANLREKLGRSE